jgi:hypothetical protein
MLSWHGDHLARRTYGAARVGPAVRPVRDARTARLRGDTWGADFKARRGAGSWGSARLARRAALGGVQHGRRGDWRAGATRGRRDVTAQSALPFSYFAEHQFGFKLLQKFE